MWRQQVGIAINQCHCALGTHRDDNVSRTPFRTDASSGRLSSRIRVNNNTRQRLGFGLIGSYHINTCVETVGNLISVTSWSRVEYHPDTATLSAPHGRHRRVEWNLLLNQQGADADELRQLLELHHFNFAAQAIRTVDGVDVILAVVIGEDDRNP